MSRPCTVCRHKRRQEIEAALVAGTTYRTIADRWRISKTALIRHKSACVAPKVAEAVAAAESEHTERLIDQVRGLHDRTVALVVTVEGILGRARKPAAKLAAVVVAAKVVKEIRGNMELLGRLTGELDSGKTTVNVFHNPQWIELRGAIVAALVPHPDARQAVLAAVERLTSGERSSA